MIDTCLYLLIYSEMERWKSEIIRRNYSGTHHGKILSISSLPTYYPKSKCW